MVKFLSNCQFSVLTNNYTFNFNFGAVLQFFILILNLYNIFSSTFLENPWNWAIFTYFWYKKVQLISQPKIISTNEISSSQESKGMGRIIEFCEEYLCLKIILPKSPIKKIQEKIQTNALLWIIIIGTFAGFPKTWV